jgi:hypothetical protein
MSIAWTGQAPGGERTEKGDSLVPTPGIGPATEALSPRTDHSRGPCCQRAGYI